MRRPEKNRRFIFLKLVKEKSSELGMDEKMLTRQLNVGFSGREEKK